MNYILGSPKLEQRHTQSRVSMARLGGNIGDSGITLTAQWNDSRPAPYFCRAYYTQTGVQGDSKRDDNLSAPSFSADLVNRLRPGNATLHMVIGKLYGGANHGESWSIPVTITGDNNDGGGSPGPGPGPSPGQLFDSLHLVVGRFTGGTTGTAKFLQITVQTMLGGQGAPIANVPIDLSWDGVPWQAPASTNAAGLVIFNRIESDFTPGNHTVQALVHSDPASGVRYSPEVQFDIQEGGDEGGGGGGGEDPPGGPGGFPSFQLPTHLIGIPLFIAAVAMMWPENSEKIRRKYHKVRAAVKATSKASKKELARALRILRGRR